MHPSYSPVARWLNHPNVITDMSRFGKDHWSTFAYLEVRAEGHHGRVDHDHMRCDKDLHPTMFVAKSPRNYAYLATSTKKYPTMIKAAEPAPDGTWPQAEIPFPHDDYSCIADMAENGLIKVLMPVPAPDGRDVYVDAQGHTITPLMCGGSRPAVPVPSFLTGLGEGPLQAAAQYQLTELGWSVASQLRQWKAAGGNFANFMPKEA